MAVYFLIFLVALLLSLTITPAAGRLALRTGMVDRPSARKLHRHPVPLLGGVAIYLALVGAVVIFSDRAYLAQLAGILVGATVVSFFGLWDDRSGLPPLVKLAGQLAAASILLVFGVQVQLFEWAPINYALTLLWVVGITNALNLLDNMDGLSAGVATVAAGFFLVLAAMNGQYLVGALAAALTGACLGFLVYNFNPARIFMGDSGSLFIGFLLAVVGLKLRFENVTTVTWMIPVIVLGIPIFDTALVTLSRLRRGLNPFTTPGKDHLSHRLVRLGLTHREAVLSIYVAGVALGLIATLLSRASPAEAYGVFGVLLVAGFLALIKLEAVYRHHTGLWSGDGSEPGFR